MYRARDTQLHREVAIKLLPEAATGDAVSEARFEREARAIARVNHPNICAIYDVGVDAGRRFLVMELLDGETFQQSLARAPFTIPELLDHGIALADALQTAHARDIIHRDLKPANIYLTTPGQLKILDFGLARRPDAADASTRAAEDVITSKGSAVGTAAYMSPEQIRGESLDVRTDLFSLGLVLYEMATGRRAFSGTTGAAVAASILNDEVARPSDVRAGLPVAVESAILKALEKDRDLRYQSAADLKADLRRVKRQLSAEVPVRSDQNRVAAPTPVGAGTGTLPAPSDHLSSSSDTQLLTAILSRHRFWTAVAGAAIVLVVAAVAWRQLGNRVSGSPMEPLTNLQIQPLTLDGMAELGAVSPDGRFLAYQPYGQRAVRVRQISGETDIPVVAAGRFRRIFSLTVTPDSNFVDVVAVTEQATVPEAWRVPLLGGNPRQILRNVGSGIGWSPDGRRMAFIRASDRAGEMTVVSADVDGANQKELTSRRAPEAFYGHLGGPAGSPPGRPAWSPDGGSIVLAGYSTEKRGFTDFVFLHAQTGTIRRSFSISGVWAELTWLDEKRLLLVGSDTRRQGASGVWVSDLEGRHLTPVTREFGFFGDLTATADRGTAVVKKFTRVSGIWTGVGSGQDAQLTVPVSPAGAALPSLDGRGGLTYTLFTARGVAAVYHLPQGSSTAVQVVGATAVPFAGQFYDVSSDGRTIVYTDVDPPHGLFKVRNDGSDRVRIVESDAGLPRLTPDGQTVLFMRTIPGLYSVPVAGGAIRTLSDRVIPTTLNAGRRNPFSISPDGKRLLFGTDQPGVVVLCELPACSNPQNLRLRSVEWAPDGAGVAYVEGTTTIMEQPLDGGAPRQIAKLDGNEPIINFRWSPDGSRLATSRGSYPNDMVIIKGLR